MIHPVRYLMMSWHQNAIGAGADYPAQIPANQQHRVVIPADSSALRQRLTLPPGAQNRVLDLLVFNQGHGDVDNLFGISPANLTTNIVNPLVQSGVRARIIVLDACLTTALVPTFQPLLAQGGRIIANMYTLNGVIFDSAMWAAIHGNLDGAHIAAVTTAIENRMRTLTRENTALALEQWLNPMDDVAIGQTIQNYAAAHERISAFRFLNEARGVFAAHGDAPAGLPVAYGDLVAIRDNAHIHANDRAIFAQLGPNAGAFTQPNYTNVRTALRARLVTVLTDANYGVQLPAIAATETLTAVGTLFGLNRKFLLASAPALPRCPTSFAQFQNGATTMDRALSGALAPAIANLIRLIGDQQAPRDVPRVVAAMHAQPVLATNYLQA
jgi:hypothetical protein